MFLFTKSKFLLTFCLQKVKSKMEFNTTTFLAGVKFYRGSAQRSHTLTRQMWFARSPEDAKIYGYVQEYELIKPAVLIRMDDAENILKLAAVATAKGRDDVVAALAVSFRVDDGQVIRNSESDQDRMILNFICSLGVDGFSSNPIRKSVDGDSFFHAEVGLCDAREMMRHAGLVDINVGVDVHAYRLKQQREEARRRHQEARGRKRQLFDDD